MNENVKLILETSRYVLEVNLIALALWCVIAALAIIFFLIKASV